MTGKLVLPGLIDPHVHLRYMDPQKEDFLTGNAAALAGGFTTILDMPNNKIPITTFPRLQAKIDQAKHYTRCDVGFYFGSLGNNLSEFEKVKDLVFGLKLYLNLTTGNFIINEAKLKTIYKRWHKVTKGKKPILLHAERDVMDSVRRVLMSTPQPTHICHVSSKKELQQIIILKEKGFPITCGVTPHHLFLTKDDVRKLGPFGIMKPPLKSKKDQEFLWENLKYIDTIESDHAPHTIKEKQGSTPPFGVPGLETTLPLLLTASLKNKLTIDDIVRLCYKNPAKIFKIKKDSRSRIEVDINNQYEIKNKNLLTKCGWSPFNGWKVRGKVKKVYIRGKKVFENGKLLAKPGFGKIIKP